MTGPVITPLESMSDLIPPGTGGIQEEAAVSENTNTQHGLEEVPGHRNDLGDWCPHSGERTEDGTCPVYCLEADIITGFDAGDRELPDSAAEPGKRRNNS